MPFGAFNQFGNPEEPHLRLDLMNLQFMQPPLFKIAHVVPGIRLRYERSGAAGSFTSGATIAVLGKRDLSAAHAGVIQPGNCYF